MRISAATDLCRGNLEVVRRDAIHGWAQDETHPGKPLVLRVFDNGVPLGEVVADRYRKDLAAAGVGDGRHAFSLLPPGGLNPDIRHLIDVRRADDERLLRGSPQVLEVSLTGLTQRTRHAPAAAWTGKLETVTRERLEGWAWDPGSPDTPMALVVLDNGEVIARVLANRYRKDLSQAGIGSGRHSFSVHIPHGLSPLTRHVIQVLGEVDGCEMPTSPVVIEAAAGFDPALEHAVRTAVAALATPEQRERVLTFLAATTEHLLQQHAEATAGIEGRLIHRQFERRWGTLRTAERQAAAALIPSSGTPKPRALVVDDRWPAHGRSSGSAALSSHMSALLKLGYSVSFVAADELVAPPGAAEALRAQGFDSCAAPYYASVEEVLRRQRSGFDVIYLHRVSNAARYLALARQSGLRTRIVYGVAELNHLRLARQASAETRPELLAQSQRMRFAECTAAGAADVVLTQSSVEAAWLRQAVKGVNVHVVPRSLAWHPVHTTWEGRRGIALLGDFGVAADVDAAHFLVGEIMPRVWRVNPSIGCVLAGSRMPAEILRLAGPRVEIADDLTQIDALFERVRISVAPQRFGAGVKDAVLDSVAAGVPCVMSPVAAEGIGLPAVLTNAGATAGEIATQLLRDHDGGAPVLETLSAMQQFVIEGYNADEVGAKLQSAIQGTRAAGGAASAQESMNSRS